MAEEDIYKNKRAYLRTIDTLDELLLEPSAPPQSARGRRKYFCRNRSNLAYFRALHQRFESRDTSYVRRNKVLQTLLFITHCTDKGLADCSRDDVDAFVGRAHAALRSPNSKRDFLKTTKWIWRALFPEADEHGRPDERLTPYAVRHLTSSVDKSQNTLRNDRLTADEFLRIVGYFSSDPQTQAFLAIAFESLARPQELCFRRLRDVELSEHHGRIWVSSHGKEGTKFLQCIDSYPYLVRWLEHHPHQADPDAFLFSPTQAPDRPLSPLSINRRLRRACRDLGIDKRITAYSLKRNGVTFRRLRGDSDLEIQHVAGWTSTKQLQTYDLSNAEDSFREQLVRRGLIDAGRQRDAERIVASVCVCGNRVGFADAICRRCKRPLEASRSSASPVGDRGQEAQLQRLAGRTVGTDAQ